MDYEIFQPPWGAAKTRASASQLSDEAISVLTSAVMGDDPYDPILVPPAVSGYVMTYDGTSGVQKNVPMDMIKIRFQDGSFILDVQAFNGGYFYLELPNTGKPMLIGTKSFTFTFTYADYSDKWRIVASASSTAPLTVTKTVSFTSNPTARRYTGDAILTSSNRQENEIYRAANYLYNTQNVFPKLSPSGGTKILAHTGQHPTFPSTQGEFDPSSKMVHIYNTGQAKSRVVGTTLHELGHLVHHTHLNSLSGIPLFLVEAFACYSGWYQGENYYMTQGRTQYSGVADVTGQGSQVWNEITGDVYSPLYIDLTDTYNQYTLWAPFDNVLSPSNVWQTAITSFNWAECKNKLRNYVSGSTLTDLNNYFYYYDAWAGTHSNFLY